MSKKTYYIYQCIATRNDGTTIERIFKIPSFWECGTISVALITSCDAPDSLKDITVIVDDDNFTYDEHENKMYGGYMQFDELVNPAVIVNLNYNDGTKTQFICKKIGEDTIKNNINRKTPELISLKGYSRFDKTQFYSLEEYADIKITASYYEKEEARQEENVRKHFRYLYSMYLSFYYYALEDNDFEYDYDEDDDF